MAKGKPEPKSKKLTVENQWNKYRILCWPHIDQNGVQMQSLKSCWYSAYFDLLNALQEHVATEPDDEKGADHLNDLTNEARAFIAKESDVALAMLKSPGNKAPI